MNDLAAIEDFHKLDIRVGTVIRAEEFKEARKPAYKLYIDFGALGILQSSAQLTVLYKAEELVGKQVVAVVNFPARQIAKFMSECLVLGAVEGEEVSLLSVDRKTGNGTKVA